MADGEVYLNVPGRGPVPIVSIQGTDGKYRLGIACDGTPDGVVHIGVPGFPVAELVTVGGRLGVDLVGGGGGGNGLSAYEVAVANGFVGTLATGTTNARAFVVNFRSNGTNLREMGRTAAMAV